jgi:hypothetical protein
MPTGWERWPRNSSISRAACAKAGSDQGVRSATRDISAAASSVTRSAVTPGRIVRSSTLWYSTTKPYSSRCGGEYRPLTGHIRPMSLV